MKQLITSLNNKTLHVSRRISAAMIAPSRAASSMMLFGTGVVLLTVGMSELALALHLIRLTITISVYQTH